jgi:hypothetical protein
MKWRTPRGLTLLVKGELAEWRLQLVLKEEGGSEGVSRSVCCSNMHSFGQNCAPKEGRRHAIFQFCNRLIPRCRAPLTYAIKRSAD